MVEQKNKQKQKTLVFVSFLTTTLAFCVLFFVFTSSSSASNLPFFGVSAGQSNATLVGEEQWGDNPRLLQRIADQLELRYTDTELPSLYVALSRLDTAKMAGVTTLNLSGLQATALPPALAHFTGLTHLDLSKNQLTVLPDYLTGRPELALVTDFNLLAPAASLPNQYNLYVLAIMEDQFKGLTFADQFDQGVILDLAKESLWIKASLANGGESVVALDPFFRFALDMDSVSDGANLTFSDYIDPATGRIIRSGTLTGNLYLTDEALSFQGVTFPVSFVVKAADVTPIDVSIWAGNEPILQDVLAELGLSKPEDLTASLLASITKLHIRQPETVVLPSLLTQFTALQSLDLSGSGVRDLSLLHQLPSVQILRFAQSDLTSLPAGIADNPYITTLDLSSNQLTDEVFNQVAAMPALVVLTLSQNKITAIREEVSLPQGLQSLSLQGNGITHFPKKLLALKNLTGLDLSHNQLTLLPQEIQLLVSSGGWLVEGNLLGGAYADQRSIQFSYDAPSMFAINGQIDAVAFLENLRATLCLTDGELVSPGVTLSLRYPNGTEFLGGPQISLAGTVLETGDVRAVVVAGVGEERGASVEIGLRLQISAQTAAYLSEIYNDRLNALPANSRQVVEEMENSSLEEIQTTVQQAENLPALVLETAKKTGKTYCYTVNGEGGFSYTWTLDGDQMASAKDINPQIAPSSGYDDQISKTFPKNNVAVFTIGDGDDLPGNAKVEINLPDDRFVEDDLLYVYQFSEESGTFTPQGLASVRGNTISFVINRAAVYAFSPEPIGGSGLLGVEKPPEMVQLLLFAGFLLTFLVGIIGIGKSVAAIGPTDQIPKSKSFFELYEKESMPGNEFAFSGEPDEEEKPEDQAEPQPEEVAAEADERSASQLRLKNEMYQLPRYTSSSAGTIAFPSVEESKEADFSQYFKVEADEAIWAKNQGFGENLSCNEENLVL